MPQLDASLYPVRIIGADIGLAGVLLLIAPVLGALMAAAALSVVAALTLQLWQHFLFTPGPDVSCDR